MDHRQSLRRYTAHVCRIFYFCWNSVWMVSWNLENNIFFCGDPRRCWFNQCPALITVKSRSSMKISFSILWGGACPHVHPPLYIDYIGGGQFNSNAVKCYNMICNRICEAIKSIPWQWTGIKTRLITYRLQIRIK